MRRSLHRDHPEPTRLDRRRKGSIKALQRGRLLCVAVSLCLTSCQQVPRSAAFAPGRSGSGSGDAGEIAGSEVRSETRPTCCETNADADGGVTINKPLLELDTPPRYTRRVESYRVPDVVLVNQDAERVRLRAVLERPEPVALNFFFTTCTTICPVMTATFSGLEKALGADAGNLRLVSISLDPEYDSPNMLKSFARRYGAGRRWEFLTGGAREVAQTYRAFDAISGSKFSHQAFTLFKMPEEKKWLRIEGLASIADLADEYRRLVKEAGSISSGG